MKYWLFIWLIPVGLFAQPSEKQAYLAIQQIRRFDLDPSTLKSPLLVRLFDHDSMLTLTFNPPTKVSSELTDSTVFSLEGLSEIFIAEHVQQNILNGIIHWSDTIINLKTTQGNIHGLTVEHLYHHRSGLPRIFAIEPNLKNVTTNDFWQILAVQKLHNPGQWNYSTLDYLVLQHYINMKTKTTWDQNYTEPYLMTINTLSSPHVLPELNSSNSRIDSNSLFSTMHLLSDYLIKKINYPSPLEPSVCVGPKGLTFAHGWYIHQLRGQRKAYTHAGHTTKHKVFLGFAPHSKTGVIMLTTDPVGTKDLGWLILRWLNQQWRRTK